MYEKIQLFEPRFGDKLTDLIIDLNYLRKNRLAGTTNPLIFFQIKHLFHLLESLGSARIEGNRTTILELIENEMEKEQIIGEEIKEIKNIELAMNFIDENIKDYPINKMFLFELHKLVAKDLNPQKEGSNNVGKYREKNLRIANSPLVLPDYTRVPDYMDEFFNFINNEDSPKYDLLKTAIAHHRFVWIHPFDNGNGRTVRLLTYAMLVKQGFNVEVGGRIINPVAVFCSDRNKYYDALAAADSGQEKDVLVWCEYVLSGLKIELEKTDKLLNYEYLSKEILLPMIKFTLEQEVITNKEAEILKIAISKQIFRANDVKHLFPEETAAVISMALKRMKDKKLIKIDPEHPRQHVINFQNSYLLRSIIKILSEKDFLPFKD